MEAEKYNVWSQRYLAGYGKGTKPQTSENLEEQLNVFRQFGLNPHISLVCHKPENRNYEVSYQCLTPSHSPRTSCNHKDRAWAYALLQNPSMTAPSLEHQQQRGQGLLWPG